MTTYKGILFFHSETGTEGGYWAFQDEQFMHLPAPDQYYCTRCGTIWDKGAQEQPPSKVKYVYYSPGDRAYRAQDTYQPDGDLGPDVEFMTSRNETAHQCNLEGHPGWKQMYPDGKWGREGTHILKTGDHLKVFDGRMPDRVLWDKDVKLPPEQDPYKETSYAFKKAMASHYAPPEDVDPFRWENWVYEEYPAELTTGD